MSKTKIKKKNKTKTKISIQVLIRSIDWGSKKFLNKLLSVQLAIQTITLIKVPLYTITDISYIHPLTSEITSF